MTTKSPVLVAVAWPYANGPLHLGHVAGSLLPPDIKEGFKRLDATETDATGKSILGTMIRNIAVAEENQNLLCQDTGIPIYNVTIGSGVEVDGFALKKAITKGATDE